MIGLGLGGMGLHGAPPPPSGYDGPAPPDGYVILTGDGGAVLMDDDGAILMEDTA